MGRVGRPALVDWESHVQPAGQKAEGTQMTHMAGLVCVCLCPPVLCTAPAKYTVFDAEGYVKPQSCIDM